MKLVVYLNIFWIVVLEKTIESPLDLKETKPVHPKGNQPWIFIGRLMLKLKFQYFGHLMQRTYTLERTLILGKTEGKRRDWQRVRWSDSIASPTQWTWIWAHSWRQWRSEESSWLPSKECKELDTLLWRSMHTCSCHRFLSVTWWFWTRWIW